MKNQKKADGECIGSNIGFGIKNHIRRDNMPSIDDVYRSDLLTAQDVIDSGGKIVDSIVKVTLESIGQLNPKPKLVVTLDDTDKKLVCNKTNAKKIAEIADTKDYTQWGGKTIELYTIITEYSGKQVNAIRVRAPTE